ncbi:SERTA domain-containing protein 3 [Aplochiton taeniatus]
MIAKGQKRKLQEEQGGGDLFGSDHQWQSVLDISLDKYQRGQELPEPSLRRSVLIANTLRQITLESKPLACDMEEESSPDSTAPSLQVKGSPTEQQCGPTVTKCHFSATSSLLALGNSDIPSVPVKKPVVAGAVVNVPSHPIVSEGEEDEDWESMSSDPDFSLSAAITSILSELDSAITNSCRVVTVPQASPRTPLKSLENLSGPDGDPPGSRQGVKGHWSGSEGRRFSVSGLEVIERMRSSYLGDVALDDLFQDIDTSLLEREMGSLGMRGGTCLSPGGDEGKYLPSLFPFAPSSCSSPPSSLSLKNLPSFNSFSSSSSSSFSSSSPSFSSNQSHVKELHELDHIMEILVES